MTRREVVDAAQRLEPDGEPQRETSAKGRLLQHSIDAEQRQRQKRRPQQLEVSDVREPVRRKREDESGDHLRRPAGREVAHQGRRAEGGGHEGAEQEDVVHRDGMHTGPDERRAGEAKQQHRVGIRQRVGLRPEDVGVEQPGRVRPQLMRDPGEPPHRKHGVVMVRKLRVPQTAEWPCEDEGQRSEERKCRTDGGNCTSDPRRLLRRRCRAAQWLDPSGGSISRRVNRTRGHASRAVPQPEMGAGLSCRKWQGCPAPEMATLSRGGNGAGPFSGKEQGLRTGGGFCALCRP